jgi:hypothetical protein
LTALRVSLPLTPTTIGTRPATTATVRSTIRSVSSSSMVGLSPVVPSGITPVTPIFT